jgi:DNA-binding beta-propeller fold protein YncE
VTTDRARRFAIAVAGVLVATASGALALVARTDGARGPAGRPLPASLRGAERFAAMSFGDRGAGARALSAEATAEVPAVAEPGGDPPVVPVSAYRTPNGWLLRPAGTQVQMLRAPTGLTVSPDARTVYVVNSSLSHEDLAVVDATTLVPTFAPATDLYMGVAADAAGNVWAAGGSRNRVWHFLAAGPAAVGTRHVGVFPGTPNNGIPATGYPGNMALDDELNRLFVVGNLSVPEAPGRDCRDGRICSVVNVVDVQQPLSPATPPVRAVPVGRDAYGIALHPAGKRLFVSNWADETRAPGATGTISVLDVARPGAEREIGVLPAGHHPTGLAISPDGRVLAVANSADDSVTIVWLDPGSGEVVGGPETVSVRTAPDAPRGATPLAVAFTPDSSLMLVALAGQNAVEVLAVDADRQQVRAIPRTVQLGPATTGRRLHVPHTWIPTGWYPSALAVAPHPGERATWRLYVTNLKGMGAGEGFNFHFEPANGRNQGTLSVIDLAADPAARDRALDGWTATVVENNRWADLFDTALRSAASDPCVAAPLPSGRTVRSDLLCGQSRRPPAVDPRSLHVVYIVKENKTFDQYFGDIKPSLPDAEADPKWLLYGEAVTTNQHNLARRYTLSDNFWADSEQSTTGHSWTSAGYANEYVEITWNTEYDQGLRGNRGAGQYEGDVVSGKRDPEVAHQEAELFEPAERFVDLLADPARNPLGLTYRVYSDDVNEGSPAAANQVPLGKWGLGSSPTHHGRDLDFPDTDRAQLLLHGTVTSHAWTVCGVPCTSVPQPPPDTFLKELSFTAEEKARFSLDGWTAAYHSCRAGGGDDTTCQRAMPNFLYVALPVDHTLGFNPLMPTPASMVADNDYATGLVVEGLSKSPFWRNTLVFIVEDDTQAAGDHVDSHRTFLLTTGGLARPHGPRGAASHQAGSFPSVLKTVEVLFGLEPLTVYDRAAVPLHDVVVDRIGDGDLGPYEAVRPPTPFVRNPPLGATTGLARTLALVSMQLDWRLDRTDPAVLRDLLYAGLRGWPLPERTAALAR